MSRQYWEYQRNIIQAFLDGKQLQWKHPDYTRGIWKDSKGSPDDTNPAINDPNLEWRIKPNTIKYRVALIRMADGRITTQVEDTADISYKIPEEYLVKWLTDWIEVEI